MILDVCYGIATVKHVHGTGMAKAVYGVNRLEPLFGERLFEILFADPVKAGTLVFVCTADQQTR